MLAETIDFLKEKGIKDADIGVILGTGMNHFLSKVDVKIKIPYKEIPHFPTSTVEFHKGVLVYGEVERLSVFVMQGRFHFYEGYSMQEVIYPVRVMKMLGIKYLLMSNAAGGINKDFKKGDLVLIYDHINLQTANPLTGKNMDELGPRFPDMSQPYDINLQEIMLRSSEERGVPLKKGVYAAVNGPNLETRAE